MKVYGISLDDVASIARFVEEQELGFPLLSDPDGSAAEKYGVLAENARYASRVSFVIDEKGVVRLIDDEVSVATHGADLVGKIQRLRE